MCTVNVSGAYQKKTTNKNSVSSFAKMASLLTVMIQVFILLLRHLGSAGVGLD